MLYYYLSTSYLLYIMTFIFISYSFREKKWGLLTIEGIEPSEFVCEIRSNRLTDFTLDSYEVRDYEYGVIVTDPKYLPRGPKFIHQPDPAMFDLLKMDVINHVSITCLGWYFFLLKPSFLSSKHINKFLDHSSSLGKKLKLSISAKCSVTSGL